ncbi:LytR/AlgR family response regulator transcription factor [Dyadobacter chenhuakuii]|jgi:two-component system response regulator LytT|uniref:LytTR family DNA-binding domain-containing protein n=1 Tax=Dyadobacter chenhuakuii TaxID=2909339 RepID=A0A9X1TRX3_9BACT|nr:LytTR family DNA-binding domain-containing protein [Dyadobacter chenhuakuii]MCF2494656.1 LytTR family DNA-binding domain-containing protein [Dyadobacter chenhuakuii]MCF2497440.1 LytTR family DNA-binding domain-containing protein [Dyadobacter chenhuakuii]USJ32022.1 LytTR family DNA-binding domain-containing protein [Dyadobacter chenhuakuii]
MTKILIIEDEQPAGEYLTQLIQKIDPKTEILNVLDSVETAVDWLSDNPSPDLIFLDVQLGDGTCFQIFEQISIGCPVIFTTAHDEYAMRAFKLNSIDYLLKPIRQESLKFSLEKYYQLNEENAISKVKYLEELMHNQILNRKSPRRSFLVPYRDKLIPLKDSDFGWLTIKNGVVVATLHDDRNFVVDKSLEELENQLDPTNFFRANRQFIISRECISEIELYFNGRLLVRTTPSSSNQILISKERVPVFKKWFEELS